MDTFTEKVKSFLKDGDREKNLNAIRRGKEFLSRIRGAEAELINLQALIKAKKIDHDPEKTTKMTAPINMLGCNIVVIFSNETGEPLCASMVEGDK